MRRFLGLVLLAAAAFGFRGIGVPWDASLLAGYEALFMVLGCGSILFMVAVVASGESTPALPPAFRPLQLAQTPRCLVCNAPGRAGWVACTRCDTPHHADCARYLAHCAVYGCDKSTPALEAKPVTRTAEPRSD